MIRFERVAEPARFDDAVRRPGATHAAGDGQLPPLWNEVLPELEAAFHGLCGYSALHLQPFGEVDHFVPVRERRDLAYEWSNFRYAAPWVNSVKKDAAGGTLLDPYEVESDWFELLLPSCQVVVSERCPAELRAKAHYTLGRLRLRDGERIVRGRRAWLEEYDRGALTLVQLERHAPQVARAVRRRDHSGS